MLLNNYSYLYVYKQQNLSPSLFKSYKSYLINPPPQQNVFEQQGDLQCFTSSTTEFTKKMLYEPVFTIVDLPQVLMDPYKLFNLFCQYGNILYIAISTNNNTAFINMQDGFQTKVATHYMKDVTLFNTKLKIYHTKYLSIKNFENVVDFSNYNRYSSEPGFEGYGANLSFPSTELYFNNVPIEKTQDLPTLFKTHSNHTPIITKLFNNNQSGILKFDSVEAANESISVLNNFNLNNNLLYLQYNPTLQQ